MYGRRGPAELPPRLHILDQPLPFCPPAPEAIAEATLCCRGLLLYQPGIVPLPTQNRLRDWSTDRSTAKEASLGLGAGSYYLPTGNPAFRLAYRHSR